MNTEDHNFQRFNELKEHAKQLTLICEEGEQLVKGFIQIIGDIWFAFYSMNVQFLKEKQCIFPYHAAFIEYMLELDHYKNWHMYTQTDDLLSVLTTVTIGEQLLHFLKQDEKVKKASFERKIAERKKELAKNKIDELKTNLDSLVSGAKVNFQLIANGKVLKNANTEIERANEIGLQKVVAYKEYLIGTIVQATPLIKNKHQAIGFLCSINGRNTKHIPLKEKLNLSDALSQNKVLREIAEMTGRFKKIAKKKMKSMYKHSMERKNITIGNELSRLLPSEFANYIFPASRLDFLMRYSESLTFMFDTKGKDHKGRGPIIICMDESSSMYSIKGECKAFCLALLMIAQKQKRDFVIIPFSSDIGVVQYFIKGQTNTERIITFCENFLGGGTNFEKPLRHSLSILTNSRRFTNADLLFVTDGSSFLSSSFIEYFNAAKKRQKFECISIVIKNSDIPVNQAVVTQFSNKIFEVNNLFCAEEVFLL